MNPARLRTGPAWALLVGGCLVLTGAGGCATNSAADARLHLRGGRIEATATTLAASEERRVANLKSDAEWLGWAHERRSDRFGQSLRGAGEFFERDGRRWNKQEELYLDEVGRRLWGKPHRIPENASLLL